MLVKLYAEGVQGKDANTIHIKFHPETEKYFQEIFQDEKIIKKTQDEIRKLLHDDIMEIAKDHYYSLFNNITICDITYELSKIVSKHQHKIDKIIETNKLIGGRLYEDDNEQRRRTKNC